MGLLKVASIELSGTKILLGSCICGRQLDYPQIAFHRLVVQPLPEVELA
jgi:hypothetical protein